MSGPALLCGAVGVLVAVAMLGLGLLEKGNQHIFNLLGRPVFRGGAPEVVSTPSLVGFTLLFCIGLAFAVLDSRGAWRRSVLGVTVLVLVAAMVPALAVWKVYFPPVMTMVGVFWTWFCTMIYASHHRMPCDDSIPAARVAASVRKDTKTPAGAKKKTSGESKNHQPESEMEKYKPKD